MNFARCHEISCLFFLKASLRKKGIQRNLLSTVVILIFIKKKLSIQSMQRKLNEEERKK